MSSFSTLSVTLPDGGVSHFSTDDMLAVVFPHLYESIEEVEAEISMEVDDDIAAAIAASLEGTDNRMDLDTHEPVAGPSLHQ